MILSLGEERYLRGRYSRAFYIASFSLLSSSLFLLLLFVPVPLACGLRAVLLAAAPGATPRPASRFARRFGVTAATPRQPWPIGDVMLVLRTGNVLLDGLALVFSRVGA